MERQSKREGGGVMGDEASESKLRAISQDEIDYENETCQ